jgi:hypothetical protein
VLSLPGKHKLAFAAFLRMEETSMQMPWNRRESLFRVRSMEIAEPVIFDLVLRRTQFGYESQWRIDRTSQSSAGAKVLADELAKALPEIMRRANRMAPSRPEVIHLKMGMY